MLGVNVFCQASSCDAEDAGFDSNRGHALRKLEKYKEAITDFTESIRLNRKQGSAYVGRGFIYYKTARVQEAYEDFMQAAEYFRNQGNMRKFHQVLYVLGIIRSNYPFLSKASLV